MAVEITETPRHTLTVNEQNWSLALTAGPAGAAGPNSVTSATTSDGTADINFNQVGIGTTSPDSKLSVTSSTINSEDILYLKSGADSVNDYLGIAWEIGAGGNGPHSAIRSFAGPSGSDARLGFLTTSNGGTTLTEGLSVAHNGNVGIGTTSPDQLLTLQGSSAALKVSESGGAELRMAAGGSLGYIGTYNINDLAILAGAGEKIRVKTNGNVGIGITDPDTELEVGGTIKASTHSDALVIGSPTTVKWKMGVYGGNDLLVKTGSDNTRLIIKNTGNVGIGTTSPSAKLDIRYDSSKDGIFLKDEAGGAVMLFGADGSNNARARFYNGSHSQNIEINSNTGSPTYFNAGNVGIGITSPSQKLDVDGAVKKAVFTVNTLPTATAGTSCYVSDSNHTHHSNVGQVVVSGGSYFVPVYYDGTDWRIG